MIDKSLTIYFFVVGVLLLLTSCTGFVGVGGVGLSVNPFMFNNNNSQNGNYDEQDYIIQHYDRYSDKNKSSEYTVDRKIEFEFFQDDRGIKKYLTTRFLSSTAEPDPDTKLLILTDKRDIVLHSESFYHKPYTDKVSYTNTVPTNSYETVTKPGGVDVVHKSDGTVEHVHRAPSTETISVQDQSSTTYTKEQEVVFNTGTYALDTRAQRAINRYSLFDFGLIIDQDTIFIYPSERQIAQIQDYLNR